MQQLYYRYLQNYQQKKTTKQATNNKGSFKLRHEEIGWTRYFPTVSKWKTEIKQYQERKIKRILTYQKVYQMASKKSSINTTKLKFLDRS